MSDSLGHFGQQPARLVPPWGSPGKSTAVGCHVLLKEGLLVLLLSRFSRVRLCATPETAALQAPPSLGFSRQEHWNGFPFTSPMSESEVTQSCLTLRDPMDCSLPRSSVHGIFQARVLKWGSIAFSDIDGRLCVFCELILEAFH